MLPPKSALWDETFAEPEHTPWGAPATAKAELNQTLIQGTPEKPQEMLIPAEPEKPADVPATPFGVPEVPDEVTVAATTTIKGIGILTIIKLLEYLKRLAEELPEINHKTYIKDKLPEAIESLIDSLRKLIIIRDRG